MQGHQPGSQGSEVLRQQGRGPLLFSGRQKDLHAAAGGLGRQQAHEIEAVLDGVAVGVVFGHPGGIGEGQGAVGGAEDERAAGPGEEGGLRVVAVQDDGQVIVLAFELPGQPDEPKAPAGIEPQALQGRMVSHQVGKAGVGQEVQAQVRVGLFQGPDGRGGKEEVPSPVAFRRSTRLSRAGSSSARDRGGRRRTWRRRKVRVDIRSKRCHIQGYSFPHGPDEAGKSVSGRKRQPRIDLLTPV